MLEILQKAREEGASDIHIIAGRAPVYRIKGKIESFSEERLMPDNVKELIYSILNEEQRAKFEMDKELDFSFGIKGMGRYRANIHYQRGTIAAALRSINTEIPTIEELNLPETLNKFCELKNGIVLVTGPTGSGKSTTLAAMINKINKEQKSHIITIEDPIEYLHRHQNSIIEQREVGTDTDSFSRALKYALRQDPDVILIGELRDLETIEAALTAAETGHLVFATLHTRDAASTIDRIVDVFSHDQQQQIRLQLSNSLKGVISQQLIPKKDNSGMALAYELLVGTPAIANLIREAKTHQIYSMLETGKKYGMRTMESILRDLVSRNIIDETEMIKRLRDGSFLNSKSMSSGGWNNFY
ncbi:type IV pilus twitching motility protein PilT [Hypnocyclicus thermotrophus]|nr:type IV pilus twitching motility protein PilT [Hypnocyclicus thermotrophus]